MSTLDYLANLIRRVDGKHDMGAGELAEAILADPRLAVVEIPEPMEDDEIVTSWLGRPDVVLYGMKQVQINDGAECVDVDNVRETAAALLAAAARKAEADA